MMLKAVEVIGSVHEHGEQQSGDGDLCLSELGSCSMKSCGARQHVHDHGSNMSATCEHAVGCEPGSSLHAACEHGDDCDV